MNYKTYKNCIIFCKFMQWGPQRLRNQRRLFLNQNLNSSSKIERISTHCVILVHILPTYFSLYVVYDRKYAIPSRRYFAYQSTPIILVLKANMGFFPNLLIVNRKKFAAIDQPEKIMFDLKYIIYLSKLQPCSQEAPKSSQCRLFQGLYKYHIREEVFK